MQGLSSDFEQFFLVKSNCCVFLRNKYGSQIGNAMEKIDSVLTRKKCSKSIDTLCLLVSGHGHSSGTGFEAIHSYVSELWAICMHYLGYCSS